MRRGGGKPSQDRLHSHQAIGPVGGSAASPRRVVVARTCRRAYLSLPWASEQPRATEREGLVGMELALQALQRDRPNPRGQGEAPNHRQRLTEGRLAR